MAKSSNKTIFASQALLDGGWQNNVRITVDPDGLIQTIEPNAHISKSEASVGIIIPGIPNLHSHAFQRAMTGLTEHKSPEHEDDDFWTWRDKMYEFANKLSPEQIKTIYKQVYKEMLEAGYTSVAEFHYIHHDKDGKPYDPPTLISDIIIEAAKEVGMPITLLPVFYAHSNFGGKDPHAGQRRFINTPEQFLKILGDLRIKYADDPKVTIGMAFHSLRATTPEEMKQILDNDIVKDKDFPIHIHVSEQLKEVKDCVEWSGKRPVEWLLDNFNIDGRWTLVHATHLTESEISRLATSGAIVGFCPSTEANLGDGTAPAKPYLELGGKWGVGSDSNTEINALAELRILEYSQRLDKKKRNVLAIGSNSTGETLFLGATLGGQQALSLPVSGLKEGARADFLVLDARHPSLYGKVGDEILESAIFGTKSSKNPIIGVMANGRWCVVNGRHRQGDVVEQNYNQVMCELLDREAPSLTQANLERALTPVMVGYPSLKEQIIAQQNIIEQLLFLLASQSEIIYGLASRGTFVVELSKNSGVPFSLGHNPVEGESWVSRVTKSELRRTNSFPVLLGVKPEEDPKQKRPFLSQSMSELPRQTNSPTFVGF